MAGFCPLDTEVFSLGKSYKGLVGCSIQTAIQLAIQLKEQIGGGRKFKEKATAKTAV
ncbi:hypothetical protein [Candidatus Bathycorpusculum sp.]|uniref:hypothetical protein n=1 Tax=Candidatus Bathycorpusculum sp. TaxID=2994959 RepID=UPI0028254BCE|nr:hypothetical protein [Candidatus Termitimicrobium sp.]